MAYKTEELEAECLKVIEEHQLYNFDDIKAYIKPCPATLFNHELNKLDTIKEALSNNKIKGKAELRKNWKKPDAAPALQIALYKLLADDEESNRINSQQLNHAGEINLTNVDGFQITIRDDSQHRDASQTGTGDAGSYRSKV